MKTPFILFVDLKSPVVSRAALTKNSIYYPAYDRATDNYTSFINHSAYYELVKAIKQSLIVKSNLPLYDALEKLGNLFEQMFGDLP